MGSGTTVNRSSPVQIGALTTWSKISAGHSWALAIKTDGSLWAWGRNITGQLGDGTTTSRSSPVQIGSDYDWSSTFGKRCTIAIKTNGTLWAWGDGSMYGQLGLNNTTQYSSPVQVGVLTNWLQIAGGGYLNKAIKTDGTLWVWGYNSAGSLGLSGVNGTGTSSPTQVGALTTWISVAAGSYYGIATRR